MSLFGDLPEEAPPAGKAKAPLPPLAERMRPRTLAEYLGQDAVVGDGRALRKAIETGVAGSLWGISILLIMSLSPEHAKLVAAFMMAALSASAIAGYTNSLIAFSAFTIPALLPFGLHMVWFEGEPSWIIAAFVIWWTRISSIATMTVGVCAFAMFLILGVQEMSPWPYIIYGVMVLAAVVIALRPNREKLREGKERVITLW